MASAAEQLAKNINFSTFGKAKELQQRILFTLGALIVYRLGTQIPIPGIDPVNLATAFGGQSGGILGMMNVFSGGAIERMAIFALNVMPYISASIIMQLATSAVPSLERLKKEGEAGRKQINQYTRYGTVLLAIAQAYGIAASLSAINPDTGGSVALDPGWYFMTSTIVTLVGGTVFLMWLGEQVTARGVGNGISLIIFAGIVAIMPKTIWNALVSTREGTMNVTVLAAIAIISVAMIVFIVFVERSQRRLLIQYPKRQQGNRMMGGENSFLPLKLNTAGVIPPIFATSLLILPTTAAGMMASGQGAAGGGAVSEGLRSVVALIGPGQPLFVVLYGLLVVFFCFFYTSIVFNPEETADNLRKHGGFIPGYRPGKRTADYLDYVLSRLTVIGAIYLSIVCLLPEILKMNFKSIPFYIGGTSILIVVSVTMDTVAQIQSHLIAHQYEGMIKRSRLGGRKK
ncbi:preprotein translocase subunit SecY [Hirschia baltica]|uniref:Protein translocase subunit SecY n=1 Tax=Hirschia baltica (strain ATCC 49814 / DSM 5838 / IFAM 1418) TaxID=582402 RepID=C6XLE7_HIRBI|nr:preprotein translocase subunit SecY [Hirschia baltica]ACT59746.1 preprotein translocase, SecY subunit [Hirschia baltica ATCC 49814]